MIKKIFLALVIGCIGTLGFMQQDQWIKDAIGLPLLRMLERSLDCTMTGRVVRVHLINPSVEFENVVVASSVGNAWTWHADHFELRSSWGHFLTKGRIALHVLLDRVHTQTLVINGLPAIWKFIDRLRQGIPLGLPITLQSILLRNVVADVRDESLDAQVKLVFDGQAKRMVGAFKMAFQLSSGNLQARNRTLFDQAAGWIHINAHQKEGKSVLAISTRCSLDLPQLAPMTRSVICVSWDGSEGSCTLNNGDQSCLISPIILKRNPDGFTAECTATVPLKYFARLVTPDEQYNSLEGTYLMHVYAEQKQGVMNMRGNIKMEHIRYNGLQIAHLGMLSFATNGQVAHGALYVDHQGPWRFSGPWSFDRASHSGKMTLANAQELEMPGMAHWKIEPHDVSIITSINGQQELEVIYNGLAKNQTLESQMPFSGSARMDSGRIALTCLIDGNECESVVMKNPLRFESLTIRNNAHDIVAAVYGQKDDNARFEGLAKLVFLKSIFGNWLPYNVHAEGDLLFKGLLQQGKFFGSLSLDGALRLPATYHGMNGLRARFIIDPCNKSCVIRDMACMVNRGSLFCNRATLLLDDAYKPYYVHVPCMVRDCFLTNGAKDFFAFISGSFLYTYQNQASAFTGSCIIDRARLTRMPADMFFKASFSTSSMGQDFLVDISVATKEPIRIKTLLVDTNAKVVLALKGSMQKPSITGSVELLSGSLVFPYRPLYITKGSVYFLPHQSNDPLIELVAKNKIKQHDISLHLMGSLSNHHLMLDSSPSLTEAQILGLLLVGSLEQSFNVMVPTLIMQNLKNFLMGSDPTSANLQAYWRNLLRPLNYIHLMPSFTDQTGRGGLRGGVEIEFGERCRALVAKNFDLTEDVRCEVEYLMSDDICLKGVRDERGDVTAEVEMRWKF